MVLSTDILLKVVFSLAIFFVDSMNSIFLHFMSNLDFPVVDLDEISTEFKITEIIIYIGGAVFFENGHDIVS